MWLCSIVQFYGPYFIPIYIYYSNIYIFIILNVSIAERDRCCRCFLWGCYIYTVYEVNSGLFFSSSLYFCFCKPESKQDKQRIMCLSYFLFLKCILKIEWYINIYKPDHGHILLDMKISNPFTDSILMNLTFQQFLMLWGI